MPLTSRGRACAESFRYHYRSSRQALRLIGDNGTPVTPRHIAAHGAASRLIDVLKREIDARLSEIRKVQDQVLELLSPLIDGMPKASIGWEPNPVDRYLWTVGSLSKVVAAIADVEYVRSKSGDVRQSIQRHKTALDSGRNGFAYLARNADARSFTPPA